MNWASLIGPTIAPALIAGAVALFAVWINRRTTLKTHREKLAFDKQLAGEKAEYDRKAADRKRHQDLAEDVLAGFYEVRDAMQAIRSPMSYSSEGKTRKRPPDEPPEVGDRRDTYFAILERFEERRELIARVMSRRHRMVAWFGQEVGAPFDQLHKAIVTVTISARMLVQSVGTPGIDAKRWGKWEAAIWWGAEDPDPVATEIDAAVAAIEQVCRPILSSKA